MRVRLESADDPRIEAYREVREPELVKRRGLFIAEGTKVVEVLLRSRFRVQSILLSEKKSDLIRTPEEVTVYLLPQEEMDRLAGFPIHRGCLALGERGPELELDRVLDGPGVVLALERISNHDNVGGIFRAAAALGSRGVILDSESADPLYRKAIRVSMGTALTLPFARNEGGLEPLRQKGYTIWALTPSKDARSLVDVARGVVRAPERLALLLGTEGEGLTDHAISAADDRWSIPMATGVDSLNVATAAAVALFAVGAGR
jgi:tRNA G18 (ribose-2'-O)-methylase SpoU